MKGPTVGPLFCEIEAFNLKTFRFQFRKHLEKVLKKGLIIYFIWPFPVTVLRVWYGY